MWDAIVLLSYFDRIDRGESGFFPSSFAGRTETKCIPRIVLFTSVPLCIKIVIYIWALRLVIKQNESDFSVVYQLHQKQSFAPFIASCKMFRMKQRVSVARKNDAQNCMYET